MPVNPHEWVYIRKEDFPTDIGLVAYGDFWKCSKCGARSSMVSGWSESTRPSPFAKIRSLNGVFDLEYYDCDEYLIQVIHDT